MWPWKKQNKTKDEKVILNLTTEEFHSLFTDTSTSISGEVVNSKTAMRCSAVFACVRLIAGAVSSSGVIVYKRGCEKKEPCPTHPLAEVLRIRPNRFMTASTFWKRLAADKILWGNAYAHIVRDKKGKPLAIVPLNPASVKVYWAWELGLDKKLGKERNRLFYDVYFEDGNTHLFDQDDIFHVPNIGWDGKEGLSTIKAMGNAVGLSIAAEKSAGGMFRNGMQTQTAISYPSKILHQDAADKLREYFDQKYSGTQKHHKPLLLTEGAQVSSLSMSADDAQLLESRQWSVIDICRFFGVNPVMIGESEKNSSWGSGVEQMGRWFNTLTLNEHFTAFEQEIEVKLFGLNGHFASFDESELTRGDTKARGEFYRVARGSMQEPGFMTVNEIRTAEGLAPIDGGNKLQRPEQGEVGKKKDEE